jgi:hypothetical protein
MRKGKYPDPDPDPYLLLMDPDPGGPKTCGSESEHWFFKCRVCRRYPAASVAVQPQPVRGGGAGPTGSPRPGPCPGLRHSSQPSDSLWSL